MLQQLPFARGAINGVCADGSFLRLAFLLAVLASDYEQFVVYQSRMGQAGLLAFWHRTVRFNSSRHHSFGLVRKFPETILLVPWEVSELVESHQWISAVSRYCMQCFMAAFIGLEHGLKASRSFKVIPTPTLDSFRLRNPNMETAAYRHCKKRASGGTQPSHCNLGTPWRSLFATLIATNDTASFGKGDDLYED